MSNEATQRSLSLLDFLARTGRVSDVDRNHSSAILVVADQSKRKVRVIIDPGVLAKVFHSYRSEAKYQGYSGSVSGAWEVIGGLLDDVASNVEPGIVGLRLSDNGIVGFDAESIDGLARETASPTGVPDRTIDWVPYRPGSCRD
jgi:hypothetical protein